MSFKEKILVTISNSENKLSINEAHEAKRDCSKHIIDAAIVSFDDMGMSDTTPGEFSKEEITNKDNLINVSQMSNDTDFNSDIDGDDPFDLAISILNISDLDKNDTKLEDNYSSLDDKIDMKEDDYYNGITVGDKVVYNGDDPNYYLGKVLDISDNVFNQKVVTVDFGNNKVKRFTGREVHWLHKKDTVNRWKYGESVFKTKLTPIFNKLLSESDYAGPLDFVPDTRINVADVLRALKNEIGEGSEGIHVNQEYDQNKNKVYKVSQIDKDKLPKKIQVQNLILELDGDIYIPNKISKEFPLTK